MDVEKKQLKNGIVVTTEAMPHLRSVSLGVWVTVGSRLETEANTGISHFIEHMLFKGTRSRSAADIARQIDSIGGQLDAFTDKEYVGYSAKVLDRHLPLAFSLVSDIIRNPKFSAVEIERERNVILEEISMVEDSPAELIQEMYLDAFWKKHPLGRPIAGTRETVAATTRADLTRYYRAHYSAANIVVAVAGNLRHRRTRALVERYLGDLQPGTRPEIGQPPAPNAARLVRRKPKLEQTHLCVGTAAPPLTSEDRYGAHVLCQILGGGLSSRLFQNIRERRGLVYSIFSSLNLYRDAGTLVVYAATAPGTAAHVLELIGKEFVALRRKAVGPEELKRAKESLKGGVMLTLESSTSRMTHLAQQEIYYGRVGAVGDILKRIDSVTARGVQRLAEEMLTPFTLTVVALGSGDGRDLREATLI